MQTFLLLCPKINSLWVQGAQSPHITNNSRSSAALHSAATTILCERRKSSCDALNPKQSFRMSTATSTFSTPHHGSRRREAFLQIRWFIRVQDLGFKVSTVAATATSGNKSSTTQRATMLHERNLQARHRSYFFASHRVLYWQRCIGQPNSGNCLLVEGGGEGIVPPLSPH